MSYPKQFYKGSYSADSIQAEERIAVDEKEEKGFRKQGFLDGHEFFSRPPEPKEKPNATAATGTVFPATK